MTKELRAIFEALNAKKDQISALLAENKVTEAEVLMAEYRDLQKKAALQTELEAQARIDIPAGAGGGVAGELSEEEKYKVAFLKAFRGKKITEVEASLMEARAALSSTAGADGGYIIPQDIQTRIKELKRDLPILENYIIVEPVGTLTGSRVVEKYADIVPFAVFTEGNDVQDTDSPQFVPVSYSIVDKGGILPVPNNLMNDTDQNLMTYLEKWLLRKSIATRNSMIITKLKTLVPVAIADFSDVKKAINVTLDPMIAVGAIVVTNQDGFNFLDTLQDADGNYILKPDLTAPGAKTIEGKRVVTISNKQLPSATGIAPIFIGDLKEFCTIFDREQMSLLATNVGGSAFVKNRTDIRAIVREDIQTVDADAVVYGQITL